MSGNIYIISAKRTPIGSFQGQFSDVATTALGSTAIKAALADSKVDTDKVQEAIMGCVLPAGLGQAPARQAALGAGLPQSVACTTVNKVCGSGMKSIMMAYDQLSLGSADVIVAGGMESMTNAPYLQLKARGGFRLGHGQTYDHMFFDGLEDPYNDHRLMGTFAEDTAEKYGFTRQCQDKFATESLTRSMKAIENKDFDQEITAVDVKSRKGTVSFTADETPLKVNPDRIPELKPSFKEGGTVTAANSSSISDGAAALVLASEKAVKEQGLTPLARIAGHATFAQAPAWFTTAPVGAIKKLCAQIGWDISSVDLFEINEAFAVVTMAAIKDLEIPHEKVNVLGGACALGHPIGSSGARIVVTLAHALKNRALKRGIAAICLGGGEATAIAIECL